jgi:nucleosome binding factor SPN SPT16 subunit
MAGTLEAHSNGFRYTSPKGEELDVMYRNIKHAFFQPSENEMITLLHFHLHDPIMVGKKKTKDVQFYTEVMDSVQTLDAGRRSMYDPDEIEEEQRERERRNKINKQYQQFVKRVQQDIWERDYGDLNLEFEIPFRELGFHGVPARSTCFIMPTVNCLVELTEMPFTVLTLSEVNLVNLERVGFNLRNFDMVFIWKDLNRDVGRIDAIPSKNLETIKDWLNSIEIKFYESKVNLNWKNIAKSIKEDPEGFVENGGWSFLDAEATDSEDEDQEMESDFAPSADGSEEEMSSDEESVEEEDSDADASEELDSDEEEGLDWDELEEQALKEDKVKSFSDDEDTQQRKKARR